MKTVFVSAFHPFICRNILRTKILSALAIEMHIIIIVPKRSLKTYKQEFSRRSNIDIVAISTDPCLTSKINLFFKKISRAMLGVRASYVMPGMAKQVSESRLYLTVVFYCTMRFFGNFKFVRSTVRLMDHFLSKDKRFDEMFDKYKPVVVISTDVQNEHDVALIRTANRYKVRVIGMVRSWDNLEILGMIRVIPNKLLVASKLLQDKAINDNDVPSDRIEIVGIPHYDNYRKDKIGTRDDLIDLFGLNPVLPIIVYAPIGDMYLLNNSVDVNVLKILSGLNMNILVRLPPTDTVSLYGFDPPKNVFFDQPGISVSEKGSDIGRNELTLEDDNLLIMEMAHADVVITGPSSIIIDASVMDTPIILVGFDGDEPLPYARSVRRLYELQHILPVINTGGVSLVSSPQEFLIALRSYLSNPGLHRVGRTRIVDIESFKQFEYASCNRVVRAIIKNL